MCVCVCVCVLVLWVFRSIGLELHLCLQSAPLIVHIFIKQLEFIINRQECQSNDEQCNYRIIPNTLVGVCGVCGVCVCGGGGGVMTKTDVLKIRPRKGKNKSNHKKLKKK